MALVAERGQDSRHTTLNEDSTNHSQNSRHKGFHIEWGFRKSLPGFQTQGIPRFVSVSLWMRISQITLSLGFIGTSLECGGTVEKPISILCLPYRNPTALAHRIDSPQKMRWERNGLQVRSPSKIPNLSLRTPRAGFWKIFISEVTQIVIQSDCRHEGFHESLSLCSKNNPLNEEADGAGPSLFLHVS